MDVNRAYVLIILILSFNLRRMRTSMICHPRLLEQYVDRASYMQRIVAQCSSTTLLLPVPVPNVEIRIADWQNMTVSQQVGDVLSQLSLLSEATQKAKSPQCISNELKNLSRSIRDITGLINKLMKKDTSLFQEVSLLHSHGLHFNTTDSMEILRRFYKLLQGKVTLLSHNLRQKLCR